MLFAAVEPTMKLIPLWPGRSREEVHEPVLADREREAVADLLQFLENVRWLRYSYFVPVPMLFFLRFSRG
jgi:hypothetical protein